MLYETSNKNPTRQSHQDTAGGLTHRAATRFGPKAGPAEQFIKGDHPKAWNRTKDRQAKSKTRLRFKMAAYLTDDVVYISFLSRGLTALCSEEVFTDAAQFLP